MRMLALLGVALPVIPLAYLALRAGGAGVDAWIALLDSELPAIVARSVALALVVGIGTILIAVPWAFLVVRSDLPARRIWGLVGALPLVIPSYVGAFCMVGAFGPRGALQQLLAPFGVERLPEIYGFGGASIILVLFTYPYVLLLVAAAWRRTDISLERAARGMGSSPWHAFRTATFPQLRPSIVAGSLLAALYTLGDFGVVSILRVDTFTRQIYLRYGALYDREGAAILGLVLCVVTFIILIFERRVLRGGRRGAVRRSAARDAIQPVALGRWKIPALCFVGGVTFFALIVPMAMLVWWLASIGSDGEWISRVATSLDAAAGAVIAAGLGAVVAAVLALPIAIIAVRAPGRFASMVETIVYSGFALPGLVAALGLTLLATRSAFWLYQTLALLVAAYVIRFLPQAVGATRSAIERVNPSLEDAARGMGYSSWATFRRITLPLAGPGVLAGAILVFLTGLKELPATLLLRPIGFDTLATEIWAHTTVSNYSEAALPALALVAISVLPLWLLVIRPFAGVEDVRKRTDPPGASGAGD